MVYRCDTRLLENLIPESVTTEDTQIKFSNECRCVTLFGQKEYLPQKIILPHDLLTYNQVCPRIDNLSSLKPPCLSFCNVIKRVKIKLNRSPQTSM